jgi:hypothetical protein
VKTNRLFPVKSGIGLFVFVLAIAFLPLNAGAANPSYDGDAFVSASQTGNNISSALTFGTSAGGAYVLFVEIDSSGNFWNTTAGTITYGGTAMTSLGGVITYNQTQTVYRSLYYIANPASGGTLVISGGTTALGGSTAWNYKWWTYSNAASSSPIGTTSINATNYGTGSSNTPVTAAFNFAPSSATNSTVLQMLMTQGNTCAGSYAAANGTVRRPLFSRLLAVLRRA